MNQSGKLAIVVPVYNEEANIGGLVESIAGALDSDGPDWEIIFVDDGSSDDSWVTLTAIAASRESVRAIAFTRNFGKEAAIQAGLMEVNAEAVVVMDADGQHPPELINAMWQAFREEGFDVVSAVKSERQAESVRRGLGARLFYWLFRASSGINLESSSDFKLLSDRVRRQYLDLPETYRYFRGLTEWLGYPEKRLDFVPPDRKVASPSRWGKAALIRYAARNLISFSSLPIKLLGALGALTFLFAIVLGSHTLYVKFSGQAVEGFTTVILVLLFIGSVLMLGMAILGGYLVEVFHQTRGRPNFVVRDRSD